MTEAKLWIETLGEPLATPLFPDVAFARILSLGGDCEVAHQLRRLGRYHTPSVFDWLVTPLDSVSAVLADDGARLGQQFEAVHAGTSARCRAYDVLYHHEFPRGAEDHVLFSLEAIDRCRAKLTHKMARMTKALRSPGAVLFIRTWPWTDLGWDRVQAGGSPATSADLNALTHVIAERFPSLDFRILVVSLSSHTAPVLDAPLDPRLALVALPAAPPGSWRASEEAWASLFDCIGYQPCIETDSSAERLFWFERDYVEASTGRPSGTPVQEAVNAVMLGRTLWRAGRSHDAVAAFATAFKAGHREASFLYDYLGLLSGETRYAEVIKLADDLQPLADTRAAASVNMLSGHAKLALAVDRDTLIEETLALEASHRWLPPAALLDWIEERIVVGEPFSLIRLGDGEARFTIERCPELHADLTVAERTAIGDVVWENWFGGSITSINQPGLENLWSAYEAAVASADVIGIPDAARLRADTGHFGYLAAQARWVGGIMGSSGLRFTDAFAHYHLERLSPFLDRLLSRTRFIGVISPHAHLADALAARHEGLEAASYTVPGEGRLSTHAHARAAASHYPDLFQEIVVRLSVPFRGAVFLVAAGLLGKIYCSRIRALGGIALDIGSLGDAWMGFDTRPGQMSGIGKLG